MLVGEAWVGPHDWKDALGRRISWDALPLPRDQKSTRDEGRNSNAVDFLEETRPVSALCRSTVTGRSAGTIAKTHGAHGARVRTSVYYAIEVSPRGDRRTAVTIEFDPHRSQPARSCVFSS